MKVPAVQRRQAGERHKEGGEGQAEYGEGEQKRRDDLLQEMFDCRHAASHLQPRVDSLAEVSLQRPVSVTAAVRVTRDTARVRVGSV